MSSGIACGDGHHGWRGAVPRNRVRRRRHRQRETKFGWTGERRHVLLVQRARREDRRTYGDDDSGDRATVLILPEHLHFLRGIREVSEVDLQVGGDFYVVARLVLAVKSDRGDRRD